MEVRVEKYGKLTGQQLKRVLDNAQQLLPRAPAELQEALSQASSAQRENLLRPGLNWACLYELPLAQHLGVVIHALNLGEHLKALVAAKDDPGEALMRFMETEISDDHEPNAEPQEVLPLVFSMLRTIRSIQVYQRSMSSLVQEVRETGSHETLFKAVRIDRVAMSAPSIADCIARAELVGDKVFFQHLRNALKGPTNKHWDAYASLRAAFAVLRDMKVNDLSDAELETLMVDTLGVYKRVPGVRKNLRAQYQQSRKIKTI